MPTLREVRRRIAGVKMTQKITKAMKMVAVAKLRRAQMGAVAARPYAGAIGRILRHVRGAAEGEAGALLIPRQVRRVALVVVTADRGLCGSFNSNLIKAAVQRMESEYKGWNEDKRVTVFCIGKKGVEYFGKRAYVVGEKFVGLFNALQYADAQRIARMLMQRYRAGEFDRVELVYNEFKSISQQRIAVEQFLPVSGDGEAPPEQADYIYEPDRQAILATLLPQHLQFQIWKVLLESNASEQAARMAAMENATENANELIGSLQLQYNKARQASITRELLEIVSGAEALSAAR
jgi:F-type H+-transporting ATPase subunit gamma